MAKHREVKKTRKLVASIKKKLTNRKIKTKRNNKIKSKKRTKKTRKQRGGSGNNNQLKPVMGKLGYNARAEIYNGNNETGYHVKEEDVRIINNEFNGKNVNLINKKSRKPIFPGSGELKRQFKNSLRKTKNNLKSGTRKAIKRARNIGSATGYAAAQTVSSLGHLFSS